MARQQAQQPKHRSRVLADGGRDPRTAQAAEMLQKRLADEAPSLDDLTKQAISTLCPIRISASD